MLWTVVIYLSQQRSRLRLAMPSSEAEIRKTPHNHVNQHKKLKGLHGSNRISHFNFRAKSCAGQDGVKNKQMEKTGKNENLEGQKQKEKALPFFVFQSWSLCPKLICSTVFDSNRR